MASIRLALDFIRIHADPDGLSGLQCPDCHEELLIHQPDEQAPDRLLAICPECQDWFLIPAVLGLMIRLPNDRHLRKAGLAPSGPPHRAPPAPSAASPGPSQ
jgi:uncharacterized protein YbaR (Trm112 family)